MECRKKTWYSKSSLIDRWSISDILICRDLGSSTDKEKDHQSLCASKPCAEPNSYASLHANPVSSKSSTISMVPFFRVWL